MNNHYFYYAHIPKKQSRKRRLEFSTSKIVPVRDSRQIRVRKLNLERKLNKCYGLGSKAITVRFETKLLRKVKLEWKNLECCGPAAKDVMNNPIVSDRHLYDQLNCCYSLLCAGYRKDRHPSSIFHLDYTSTNMHFVE